MNPEYGIFDIDGDTNEKGTSKIDEEQLDQQIAELRNELTRTLHDAYYYEQYLGIVEKYNELLAPYNAAKVQQGNTAECITPIDFIPAASHMLKASSTLLNNKIAIIKPSTKEKTEEKYNDVLEEYPSYAAAYGNGSSEGKQEITPSSSPVLSHFKPASNKF